jgi:hypothetical protein
MEIKSDNVYTLESVTGNIANIKVNSKISSTDTTTNIAGTVTGTMHMISHPEWPLTGTWIQI